MIDRLNTPFEAMHRSGLCRWRSLARATVLLAVTGAFVLSLGVANASASQQVIDYFGTQVGSDTHGGQFLGARDVAVNYTGAGPADPGDVYVADSNGLVGGRIQRFAYDDNGTPGEPYDDSYDFVSAWGADVVQEGGVGDQGNAAQANFEICTVASQCKAAAIASGNGTVAGDGAMFQSEGIAVDQDTGRVYVSDSIPGYAFGNNARIDVYEGDGTFLYSFGFDVDASEPGTGYEICPATHVCKAGVSGSGVGQVSSTRGIAISPPDGNPATGTVYLADPEAHRITTYGLAGESPSSIGSAAEFPGTSATNFGPTAVAVDSRGIVYASRNGPKGDEIVRYDSENADGEGVGFIEPIGGTTVAVTGGPGDAAGSSPYRIVFQGPLRRTDVSQIVASNGAVPLSGGAGASVTTATPGSASANEVQEVKIAATAGQFRLSFEGQSTSATGTGDLTAGSFTIANVNTSTGTFVRGEAISGPGIPPNTRVDSVGNDTLGLTNPASATSTGAALTADLPSNATADVVQSALEALSSVPAPLPSPISEGTADLEVDPDSDGAGPEEDVLYVLPSFGNPNTVLQLGPANAPGLGMPPAAADDQHGALVGFKYVGKLGLDPVHGRLFVSSEIGSISGEAPLNSPPNKQGVYVLGPSAGPPTASLDAITDVTATTASVEGTINPNSGPAVSYSLEYSRDGVNWSKTETTLLGTQSTDQPVTVELDPPGTGLEPNTLYHVRLLATKAFQAPVVGNEQTFTTAAIAPQVETTGSPVRTATTAHLEGRIDPHNAPTTYSFEYIDDAAYQANVASSQPPFSGAGSTAPKPAGSGGLIELVSTQVEGLEPNTIYHYRLLADNGKAGSPAQGQEKTLTTRASDAPLEHGRLPGPVGSDRAYEQVTMPDTGGNPTAYALGFADDGDGALYDIAGGTPISDTGSLGSIYYAERTAGGWQTKKITPPRSELFGSLLVMAGATSDLSTVLMENIQVGTAGSALWKLALAGSPSRLFETSGSQEMTLESGSLSANGSRVTASLLGAVDPAYPAAGAGNIYDLSSGAPQLVSLLPGDVVADCGAASQSRLTRWLSAEGRYAFFLSVGQSNCQAAPLQLYMRDLEAGQSKLISSAPLSGAVCGANFLKATSDGGVFFWTQSRLAANDTPAAGCEGSSRGDVYRYDIETEALKCVTCVVSGLDADVVLGFQESSPRQVAVADDGSRLYFSAGPSLLPGTPPGAAYRLDVASGNLAYLGKGRVGTIRTDGNAITPDGSVLIFRSDDPNLNTVGGTTNGGTNQYYRYDDRDRSLVCLSCPPDGSAPFEGIPEDAALTAGFPAGPNTPPLSDDGETIAFAAPSPLVNADQNTPKPGPEAGKKATDVYEWRDGRTLLITDGLTDWPKDSEPVPAGVSPSGKDLYFLVAAQYTQDALDGYKRLYDARIGGGFEFPDKPRPCPLEVCQGTPKGVPEEQEPSSGSFNGVGNAAKTAGRCAKPKRLVRSGGKARCVKPKQKKKKAKKNRANHNRRAAK